MSDEAKTREAIESVVQAQKEMYRAVFQGSEPSAKVERKMVEEAQRAAERRSAEKNRQVRYERRR